MGYFVTAQTVPADKAVVARCDLRHAIGSRSRMSGVFVGIISDELEQ